MSDEVRDDEFAENPRDAAVAKLKSWADHLEVDTESEDFQASMNALVMPVMKGRLDFDFEDERFRYQLLQPIANQNSTKEIVEIRELDYEKSKVLDRFKENESVAQATAMIARSCGLQIAEAEKLINRDIRKINAVIVGFFG